MKRHPSKADIRNEIEEQVSAFLNEGGAIQEFSSGTSGLKEGEQKSSSFGFERPRQERTPIPEVVAAIESRRRKPRPTRKSATRQPRKKVIYDDFGEPLRWVWVDE